MIYSARVAPLTPTASLSSTAASISEIPMQTGLAERFLVQFPFAAPIGPIAAKKLWKNFNKLFVSFFEIVIAIVTNAAAPSATPRQ
uniref:Uncharacterized protein n=1 Tax=Romanomermis culicivorax TaxID=13658 RepID=A0A915KHR4_ROMCU